MKELASSPTESFREYFRSCSEDKTQVSRKLRISFLDIWLGLSFVQAGENEAGSVMYSLENIP